MKRPLFYTHFFSHVDLLIPDGTYKLFLHLFIEHLCLRMWGSVCRYVCVRVCVCVCVRKGTDGVCMYVCGAACVCLCVRM